MNCRLKTILSRRGIFTSRSTLKWPRQLKSGADLCLIKRKSEKKNVRGITEELRWRRSALPVSEKDTQYVFRGMKNAGDLMSRWEKAVFGGRRRRQTRQLRASSPPKICWSSKLRSIIYRARQTVRVTRGAVSGRRAL